MRIKPGWRPDRRPTLRGRWLLPALSALTTLLAAAAPTVPSMAWSAAAYATSSATNTTFARPTSPTSAADAIECLLRVNNPHFSYHAHAKGQSRVNATATMKCTKKVSALSIRMELFKNGKLYKRTGWKNVAGKSQISHNVARRCLKGQKYQAVAQGVVAFPPRYVPPTARATVKSKIVVIDRCTR